MRVFVVGCGSIGKRHVRNLKSLGIEHIVAYDADKKVADLLCQECGIENASSLQAGINSSPDCALVCVPHQYHIPVATELASEGIHLFIEKPLSPDLRNVDHLRAIIDQKRLTTMVACNYRFDPGLALVKSILQKNIVGKAVFLRSSFGYYLPDWRPGTDYRNNYAARKDSGGGVLLDRIHEFDYVMWLLGDVLRLEGMACTLGNLDIETEDIAEVVMLHRNGTLSSIHVDYLRREYSCTCEIVATEGMIQWDFGNRSVRIYDAKKKTWLDYSAEIPKDPNTMYVEQMGYFLKCVEERSMTSNTVADSIRTLEVVFLARQRIMGA